MSYSTPEFSRYLSQPTLVLRFSSLSQVPVMLTQLLPIYLKLMHFCRTFLLIIMSSDGACKSLNGGNMYLICLIH